MKIALITKSATTSSGARAPIDLALALRKSCDVTIFAQNGHVQKNLRLILYKNSFDLFRSLKTGGFELISFHSTLMPLIAAKLTGIPIVRTYYGTQFDAYLENFLPGQKPNYSARLKNLLANIAIWANQIVMLLLSNRIVAISGAARKELKKLYFRNSQVIYLGSNLKPTTTHYPLSTTHYPTILSVSRFTPYKGFHKLIEVVKNIREEGLRTRLIIAGSGEKKNYLQYLRKIKDRHDQIIVSPSDQTLKGLYRQCDIVASCDRYPFFGLSILEAAQFGKPVVALNHLAAKALIIHGKTGFVANSPDELKKSLVILIRNEKKRLEMGKAALAASQEKFNMEKIARSYIKVLNAFIKTK